MGKKNIIPQRRLSALVIRILHCFMTPKVTQMILITLEMFQMSEVMLNDAD